jgi:hypothetical protein
MAEFSGLPETRWELGEKIMTLLKPFSYTDKKGKKWEVPANAWINGATIPRALWSIVGSPFVGKYRRASIIHDFYVGEGNNPNVTFSIRRAADKMFYRACRTDGISRRKAVVLYIGVSLGSWASKRNMEGYNIDKLEMGEEFFTQQQSLSIDEAILQKYNHLTGKLQAKSLEFEIELADEDDFIDEIEAMVDAEIE